MLKRIYILQILLIIIFTSCTTPRDVTYFQNSTNNESIQSSNEFSLKYNKGDILEIVVSAPDLETVTPFNTNIKINSEANTSTNKQGNVGSSYVVNEEGNIEFPILGKIKVLGLSQNEVQTLLKAKLKPYVDSTFVSIKLLNFKITILGEVNSPGVYQISDERITIVEAIGLAKDLNIRGKRENVTVVRENEDGKIYHKLDMTSKNIFESPIYYLKQNDIVYVEPNKAQIKSSKNNNWTRILAAVSSVLSIALSVIALSR